MRDITEMMFRYRECVRNLWNVYFFRHATDCGAGVADEFDDLCMLLFSALVLKPLDHADVRKCSFYDRYPRPLSFIKVRPLLDAGVPLLLPKEEGSPASPPVLIRPADADLCFIDFCDPDPLGFRDFQECRVRIAASERYPDLTDHDAIVNTREVRFIFDGTDL